jgi:hypothetical protein
MRNWLIIPENGGFLTGKTSSSRRDDAFRIHGNPVDLGGDPVKNQ